MELNPSHKVTKTLSDRWHVIAAMIMRKQNLKEIVITAADVDELLALQKMPTVVAHDKSTGLHILFFDSEKEALTYAAENQLRG